MKIRHIAAALIGTGLSLSVFAQDGAGAPEQEAKLSVLPEFTAVDANEDGMIDHPESESLARTLDEQHAIVFQFTAVDANNDGLINNEEYVAYDHALAERLGIA